ncbi:MAG: helical backbone metal receptor [Bacteroidota bacterium]
MERTLSFVRSPKRIVSLVPSQTELLFYLGLGQRVVGVTKFCVHPIEARSEKTIVGGTKRIHFDKITALSPDLIIGNKEENTKEDILRLEKHFPIWMSDILTLEDALKMVREFGELFQVQEKANALAANIELEFNVTKRVSGKKALYFIWKDPYMVAGSETFINAMLEKVGFENAVSHLKRYPKLSTADIKAINPDVILLSSEPYPFKPSHVKILQQELPDTQVILVNGEYFSWYGSRLVEAPKYFRNLDLS